MCVCMIYIICTSSHSSYNGYKFNSLLTCFRRGFIAQLVEHHTGIAEVMGSNPVEASELFLGFLCNCLSRFRTARITLASTLENRGEREAMSKATPGVSFLIPL